LASSLAVFTQAPEQREYPESHTVPHPLPEQVAVPLGMPGQTVPQPPQLPTSARVSTQLFPQRM